MRQVVVFVIFSFLTVSCEEIISVPDISEENIEVLAPLDGATLESEEVTFSWNEIDFVDQYQIQVVTPSFINANQIVLDTILRDSLNSFRNFTTTLNPNFYEWRIRGANDNFTTPYTLQSLTLITGEEEIEAEELSEQSLVIISPVDGLETLETVINLSWEDIEEATVYRILITDLSDNSIFLEQAIEENDLTVNFPVGAYAWAVRGENDSENTPYTEQTITIIQ